MILWLARSELAGEPLQCSNVHDSLRDQKVSVSIPRGASRSFRGPGWGPQCDPQGPHPII